ncbi:hypothetical protein [Rudaea sp.]|uniref:hypothetical protein n=1 Tax=Rudaea sp. TaxID=2136325 RepID=UPI002ED55D79
MSYQFNYTLPPLNAAAPKADPNAPTYASEDGMVASLSSQECIFQIRRTGEPHVMTFQVLQAMDQCREFRTLDEHVARIQSTQPALASKRDDVKRVLESLVQRQLLISDAGFVERLGTSSAIAQAPMRAVFIRACDRPQQLAHLLTSLAEYERRFRAGRRYVLLDDSVLQASINEQRDLLREFARTTGCKVHYIGHAERTKIVDKLAREFPQSKATIQNLLVRDKGAGTQRFGGGRGWNMALLLSAGSRFALLDDDLRLSLKRPPFAQAGLDPNPSPPMEAAFLANMEEAFGYGEDVDQDPFALHLDACGQMLGTLTRSAYPLSRQALRGMNLSRLELLNEPSRVIATQVGTYGSARTENGLWLYRLEGRSREEFWRERASYLRNTEAQHVWFGVAQAQAKEVTGFTPFTFDNSRLLPCTNSLGRGEDSLWSALARYADPDAIVLELPEAIGHVQESQRLRSGLTRGAFVPRVNMFLRDYVHRQFGLYKSSDPGQRLHLLADVLRDLSGATEAERISNLREYMSFIRADLIDRMQHQIEAATEAPVYWQADARAIVESNAKALLAKAPPRLAEWPEDIDAAGCAKALASEMNSMADALEHWPALWRHAAEQGEKLLGTL